MKKLFLLFLLLLFIPLFCFGQNEDCSTKIIYENNQYNGCVNDAGNPDGYGKMTFENQDVYIGFWKNGKRNGLGKFTTNEGNGEGDKYVGEFKDEKFWNGTTYEIDGNIFGNWVNGKLIKQ